MKHILQLFEKVDLRLRLELNSSGSSGSSAELTLVKTERKSNSANRFFGNIQPKVPRPQSPSLRAVIGVRSSWVRVIY